MLLRTSTTGKPILTSMSSGNKTPPLLPQVSSLTTWLNLADTSFTSNFLTAVSVEVVGGQVETFCQAVVSVLFTRTSFWLPATSETSPAQRL